MLKRCIVSIIAGFVIAGGELVAQQPWPVTLEASLGVTRGFSDNNARYRGARAGPLADILFGVRLHPPGRSGAFVAMTGTYHAVNAVKTADCPLAPDGGCIPWFPGFTTVSLLAGWESARTNWRLLAGPTMVERKLAASGRVDVAFPMVWHAALTFSLSTLFVPSWEGDTFLYPGFTAGLRLR